MYKNRKVRGAALGLVAVALLVLIIIGFGAYFLVGVLSGGRQLHTATESGNLQFAKQALVNPKVTLDTRDPIDRLLISLTGPTVNLKNYNQLVSAVSLMLVNAHRDGNAAGINNAKAVLERVQSNDPRKNSIGYQLKTRLERLGTSNPQLFLNIGEKNPRHLLSSARLQQNSYSVAFMKQQGPTNIDIQSQAVLQRQMPYDLDTWEQLEPDPNWLVSYGGRTWLKGYAPLDLKAATGYGVPLQPFQQPHGMALAAAPTTQPGADDASLPPNGFVHDASNNEQHSGMAVLAKAASIVGCLNNTLELAVPMDYIEIDNTNVSTVAGTIKMPVTWNGVAYVLGTDGAPVDQDSHAMAWPWFEWKLRAVISRQIPGDMTVEGLCDRTGTRFPNLQAALAAIPQGDPDRRIVICTDNNSDAYGENPEPACLWALNENNGTPGVDGNLIPPMDRAFVCYGEPSPLGLAGYADSLELDAGQLNLPAASCVQTWAAAAFTRKPYYEGETVTVDGPFYRGLEVWGGGHNPANGEPVAYTVPDGDDYACFNKGAAVLGYPITLEPDWQQVSDRSMYSHVSRTGTIAEYASMVSGLPYQETTGGTPIFEDMGGEKIQVKPMGGGPNAIAPSPPGNRFVGIEGGRFRTITSAPDVSVSQRIRRWLEQRIEEIKPGCPAAERDAAINTPIEMGHKYFIWRNRNDNRLVVTKDVPPPNYTGALPDGTPRSYWNYWDAARTVVDPRHANGVHDYEFWSMASEPYGPVAHIPTRERVILWQASGAQGTLGLIKFDSTVNPPGIRPIPIPRPPGGITPIPIRPPGGPTQLVVHLINRN